MKILICYFSGTGNTEKVVRSVRDAFESHDCSVLLHKVEKGLDDLPDDFDMLGIAYPVHAFNAPEIVVDFAKKLEKSPVQKKLFIFKTSGEPLKLNNISSLKLVSILKKKNFVLTNEYHYCMPYNMIFRHTDQMAYDMWQLAQQLIPIDVGEIMSGKSAKLKKVFCGRFIAWIMRIEWWGGRFNGKKYKVTDKCINCQKCVRSCPVGNITIKDGKFVFGKKCIMCMRCSFHCPTNAIKIGWFESWKVNGAYNFNKPENAEDNKHDKFCKKSYKKYFERGWAKVNSVEADASSNPGQIAEAQPE